MAVSGWLVWAGRALLMTPFLPTHGGRAGMHRRRRRRRRRFLQLGGPLKTDRYRSLRTPPPRDARAMCVAGKGSSTITGGSTVRSQSAQSRQGRNSVQTHCSHPAAWRSYGRRPRGQARGRRGVSVPTRSSGGGTGTVRGDPVSALTGPGHGAGRCVMDRPMSGLVMSGERCTCVTSRLRPSSKSQPRNCRVSSVTPQLLTLLNFGSRICVNM